MFTAPTSRYAVGSGSSSAASTTSVATPAFLGTLLLLLLLKHRELYSVLSFDTCNKPLLWQGTCLMDGDDLRNESNAFPLLEDFCTASLVLHFSELFQRRPILPGCLCCLQLVSVLVGFPGLLPVELLESPLPARPSLRVFEREWPRRL